MGIQRDQSLSSVAGRQRGLLTGRPPEMPTCSVWGVAASGCPGARLPVIGPLGKLLVSASLSEGITGHRFNQYAIISSVASIPMFIMRE